MHAMGRLLHRIVKMNYPDKRMPCLKTEITVVSVNTVSFVYLHIIFFIISLRHCRPRIARPACKDRHKKAITATVKHTIRNQGY